MSIIASTMLLVWPFAVVSLLAVMPPRRAAIWVFVIGLFFLPLVTLNLPGLPAYGKFTATSFAMMTVIFLFDAKSALGFRLSWLDLPMISWLLVPLLTSISNGLGIWDGFSGAFSNTLTYGVPYFAGRLYLRSPNDWAYLSKAFLIGVMLVAPLAVYEMRMSPHLHETFYGFAGRTAWDTRSGLGPLQWIPVVFMNSAFELSMSMAIAALVSFWSWLTAGLERVCRINTFWLFVGFTMMTLLCRKWSGAGLLLVGLVVLYACWRLKSLVPSMILVAVPLVYISLFSTGVWRCDGVHDALVLVSQDRADSLQFRIDNDKMLVEKALQRPILGWGGWGRSRIYDDEGNDISITDAQWTITLGIHGFAGLLSSICLYALPVSMLILVAFRRGGFSPTIERVVPFAVILGLHLCDNIFNAFPNCTYPLFSGGITSVVLLTVREDAWSAMMLPMRSRQLVWDGRR